MRLFGYTYRIEHGNLRWNPVPFIEDPRALIDGAYLVQGHTLKKGPNDSLAFFSLGYVNEILLPNAGYHLYNYRSLTIPLVPQEESCRHSVSGLPGRITRSRTRREGLQQPQPQPLSTMRLVVHRSGVPAPLSGHGRPQGTGPLVPAPVDP